MIKNYNLVIVGAGPTLSLLYYTSIEELMEVANAGKLMLPKSTWFEFKLHSGVFIHKLSD